MSRTRSLLCSGAVGAAALTLAACGGGSSGGGDTLSASAYITSADKVCAGFRPASDGRRSNDIRKDAPALRKDVAGRRKVYDQVQELDPPGRLEASASAFLATTVIWLARLSDQAAAAARGDDIGYQESDVAASQAGAKRARIAAEIGFRRCGQIVGGANPLTPAGFVPAPVAARADAACKQATAVVVATKPKSLEPGDVAVTAKTNAPAARAAYLKVSKIEVPPANRAKWDAFLQVFDERVKDVEAVAAGRPPAKKTGLYAREAELTRRLGLTVCGQSTALGV
jgi:hypothetical protein